MVQWTAGGSRVAHRRCRHRISGSALRTQAVTGRPAADLTVVCARHIDHQIGISDWKECRQSPAGSPAWEGGCVVAAATSSGVDAKETVVTRTMLVLCAVLLFLGGLAGVNALRLPSEVLIVPGATEIRVVEARWGQQVIVYRVTELPSVWMRLVGQRLAARGWLPANRDNAYMRTHLSPRRRRWPIPPDPGRGSPGRTQRSAHQQPDATRVRVVASRPRSTRFGSSSGAVIDCHWAPGMSCGRGHHCE